MKLLSPSFTRAASVLLFGFMLVLSRIHMPVAAGLGLVALARL